MFSKNLLTREQLDELLQMSNLKKGIFSPTKRRSIQHEPAKTQRNFYKAPPKSRNQSNIRSQRDKRALIQQVLQQGSGLVLESNSVKRNFTITASPAKKRIKIDLPMETEAPVRKPLVIANMDVNSELS